MEPTGATLVIATSNTEAKRKHLHIQWGFTAINKMIHIFLFTLGVEDGSERLYFRSSAQALPCKAETEDWNVPSLSGE